MRHLWVTLFFIVIGAGACSKTQQTRPATISQTSVANAVSPAVPIASERTGTQMSSPAGTMAGPGGPEVLSFVLEPANPLPGTVVWVQWQVVGATDITIWEGYAHKYPRTLGENLPPSGTLEHTLGGGIYSTVITLMATNAAGENTYAGVEIAFPCSRTFFFGDDPYSDSDCPAGLPATNPISVQMFEHGVVLQAERFAEHLDRPAFFVLFTNGVAQYLPASSIATTPPSTTIEPPTGFYLPDGVSAAQWHFDSYLQESLGWATAPAQHYPAQMQVAAAPESAPKGYGSLLYVMLPDGRVVGIELGYAVAWHYVN
jgi:hypothetical protein